MSRWEISPETELGNNNDRFAHLDGESDDGIPGNFDLEGQKGLEGLDSWR